MNKYLSKTFSILVMAITISACGDKRDSEAEAITGLMGALGNSNGTMSINAIKTREKQKLIAKRIGLKAISKAKAHPPHSLDVCSDLEAEMEAALGGACTVSSCTGDGATGLAYSLACSGMSGDQTCGAKTYTISDFSYNLDFSFAVSGASISMSFDMDMNGDVTGDLTGAVSCQMGIDFTYTGAEDSSSFEFDCDNSDFSCTIDGTELSCARLKAVATEMSCD